MNLILGFLLFACDSTVDTASFEAVEKSEISHTNQDDFASHPTCAGSQPATACDRTTTNSWQCTPVGAGDCIWACRCDTDSCSWVQQSPGYCKLGCVNAPNGRKECFSATGSTDDRSDELTWD